MPTKTELDKAWNTRAERTCEGCKHDGANKFTSPCFDCTHENYNDCYEPKVVE